MTPPVPPPRRLTISAAPKKGTSAQTGTGDDGGQSPRQAPSDAPIPFAGPAVMRLIKACRALGLVVRGAREAPGGLLVTGDRATFPHRLWDVARALADLDGAYEADYLMPRALAEVLIEQAAEAGADVRDMRAAAEYFLDGKSPQVNRRGIMRIIQEKQRQMRELGGAAPRPPTLRRAPPGM